MLKKIFHFFLENRDIPKGSLAESKKRIILWDEDTEIEAELTKKKKKKK